jgi:hypothetical protein
VPKGVTSVTLSEGPDSLKVELRGIQSLQPTMQWRLTDQAGRHYLLLNIQDEIVPPDQAVDAMVVKIGRQSRDLLAARGITDAVLSVHLLNQAGLNRTVALALKFRR